MGGGKNLKGCYEAGPTGYALYWQLTQLGIDCEVIAPSLIPSKAGDRVKTNRRDAEKLARSYQNGDLTAVWVPTPEHEALRDLVRQSAAAKSDESRAKHRLMTLLLRHGTREPTGSRAWTHPWWRWLQSFKFDHEARQIVLADCIAEILYMGERLDRLDKAIDRLIETAPAHMRAVIEALQALRGVAKLAIPDSFHRSIPVAHATRKVASPTPATRTYAECSSNQPGMPDIDRSSIGD